MSQTKLKARGSKTAKDGFKNEIEVINIFNSWKSNKTARAWLAAMGYNLDNIKSVQAMKVIGSYKADAQLHIRTIAKHDLQTDSQNLQIKLVSNPQGFNQIDKRWVDKYVALWQIPEDIKEILKKFTGEIKPAEINGLRDKRRLFFNEMNEESRIKLLNFIDKNKVLIISDLLKGRGEFSADWVLVILKTDKELRWALKSINEVIGLCSQGVIRITDQGNLKIGKIGMQRKGGDSGRDSANMLQFKINPVDIFNIQ